MAKKMKKVLSCLVVLIILMSTMPVSVFALEDRVTATTQLGSLQLPDGIELKHDDGEVDMQCSLGSDAVFFSNDVKLNINGIKICGLRYGDVSREFEVEIWDTNLKTLYSASYDYADFFTDTYLSAPSNSDLKWVTIDVPAVEVNGNFYVAVFAYSGPPPWVEGQGGPYAPKGGIEIGRDSDTKSGNSFIVNKYPNELLERCQDNADWMIRAVVCGANGEGHAPVITSITADPSVVSQGGSSTITVVASDLDGDELSYSYEPTGGEISGDGSVVTWTADVAAPSAPPIVGKFKIDVTVSDGTESVSDSVDTTVTDSVHNEYTFVTMWPELPQPWYFSKPHGIAVDSSGNVFVADTRNSRIQKFNSDGNFITKWDSPYPYGIAVDSSGNVFVTGNNQIQKFDSNGIFITKWGERGRGNGEFHTPWGIAVDSRGYVYVADTYNHRIQKFDSDGNFITKWGSSGTFDYPCGITVDSSGNVFVAEADTSSKYFYRDLSLVSVIWTSRIQKFDSEGNFITKWGENGRVDGLCMDPFGIAVDSSGYVYVADTYNHRIQKFDSDGNFVTLWNSWGARDEKFVFPFAIAVDSGSNVFVVDAAVNGRILKFDSGGNFIAKWGSSGTGEGEFDAPYGIEVDNNGNVFVADAYYNRILKFDSGGNFITKWGSSNHLSWPYGVSVDNRGYVYVADTWHDRIQKFDTDGNFIIKWNVEVEDTGYWACSNPYGIAVDSSGNVFVAASWNDRIRKFDFDGNFITKWGESGTGDGEFDLPWGIAVDSSGNVFVADTYNHRIQKFDSVGNFITKWGESGTGDGEFDYPRGIDVDGNGNVYVADTYNHRIQKFDAVGNFITQWGDLGSERGEFSHPSGIAIDGGGNVYVADTGNSRIQKFAPTKGGDTPNQVDNNGNGVEDMREIIEEVEKMRDKSISKINRDVDNTATLQAKIGKEVYDKEEKDIVLNSLQHIQGLLMPGSGILDYFMQFAIFELIDNSFKHFDKEIAEELLNTQSQVDVGCRILHHERDIQDYAMYNTGQENRLVILTEPYESGSHIKKVPNELEIYRYDLHTGIFQFVEKIFRDGVGPDANLNIETGDLNNDGFEDLLLISGRHIDVYFYDADTDKFDTSESIQVKAQHTLISDISIGDLDNKGHNELVILSRDFVVSPMSIDVYRFDGNQLNGPLTEPLEPDIATWYPHLVIGDVNNDDSHKNELLVMGSTNAILYHYTGTEFNEISEHALPILYAKDIAIGDIDNKKDAKNEFLVIEKGGFSDSIVPFRYNLNTREFDRLDSSQLENDVGNVFKLEICDSTNTGFNNVITGSKNGIKSYHYEESSEQLEQYLRNEYSDAFMHKEGGPEYHKVVEDINNQYDTFENDIKTKDLTNYPTEEVLKYLKELNKNLDSSSDSETSILVMKTAEKTSEIKKIGTVSQISALVDKTIDDSENNRKTINILGYTIAGGTAVKALLFIKSGGASMVAEAFIYSTTMTGTKYLEQFEELSLHEKLQYQSLMSLIALSSEVSVTNDAFQNAVDFTLNPTINSIEVIEWPDETCSQGTDLPCGVWLEIDEGDTFGHGTIVVKVKNNGENAARVKLFAEVYDYSDIIAISSSKEFTEISAGEYEVIDLELNVPGIKEWGNNYYSPYRIKIYATSSSSMIGLPWHRSIPLYVDTKQGLDAAKLQMIKEINGQINQGTTIDYPYTTEPSTVQTTYILDYPGSDLDLHIYDSEGHHVGINYGTGKTEIGIQGATYSGPDSIPEYISILNSGDKTYTAKIVAIETTENESYSLITIESPKLPPLVSISPSNITISGSPGEKVNATLTLREYGGFSDLNEIGISSSDLTNDVEIDVPSSNVAFRIPSTTIPAGSGITVNLTIDIPKTAEAGKTYLGSIKAIDTSGATDNASFCLTISTPKTIFVDSNFTDNSVSHEWNTINKAILDANNGDAIFVYTGTYRENIILNKELTLTGENKNATIIDGGVSGKCIHVTADSVIISGFTIQNGTDGVYLDSSDGCNIEGNIIADNGNGISIYNSHNNQIYHNNLIDNGNQAYGNTGTNQWDNGYPSGGNYWSDYTGYDHYSGPNQDIRGGDGIIDAPYSINAGAQDKYPFMLTDTVAPEVIGNTPSGSNVPVNTSITITFSEAMDHESVESAFSTSPSTVGRYSWSGNTMTYAPNSNLETNTMYTVTVGTDAKDLAGNNLQPSYSWQFTTTSSEPTMDIQAEIRNIWTSDIISPIVLFGKNANLGQVLQADLDDDSFSDPLPSYDDRCLGDKNYDKSVISRFGEGDDKVRIVLDITGGTGFKPGSEGYIKILNPEYKITKIYGHSDYVGVQPPTMSLGTPTISTDYSGFGVVIDMEEGSVSWQGRGTCPACACRENTFRMEFLVERVSIPADSVIFADDFDSYPTGSFPSSGGWNLKYNGMGDSYQIVDNAQSVSPPNSLNLEGEANWAASADHPLAETPDHVTYEVDVKVTQPGSSVMNYHDAAIGLENPNIGTWGTRYAGVIFGNAENRVIQPGNIPFNFDQWYHIKVKADMNTGVYDVWLDDQLIASDISTSSNGDYTDIRLEGGNNAHTRVWFDNVKVNRGHYPSQDPNGGLNGVPYGNTITNTIGMEFVLIPAGEFDLGSPSDEEGRSSVEGPVHHVNIEKAFYMGRYEVTQKQWRETMGDNPFYFESDDLPVEQFSWDDVQEFIKKLNEKEGTDKYRLPSEAEWEYACRAGTTTRYSFGDDESKLGDYAWYDDNSGYKTHLVGQKKPNPWGLYDMHGNVGEWVRDSWHVDYNDAPADGSAWESGDGAERVYRGGGWFGYARVCRSAARYHGDPRHSGLDLGFRLLKEQ